MHSIEQCYYWSTLYINGLDSHQALLGSMSIFDPDGLKVTTRAKWLYQL